MTTLANSPAPIDMASVVRRLEALGVTLPRPAAPIANYTPFVRSGAQVIISGQLCLGPDGKLAADHVGRLGDNVSPEAGAVAARLCAINVLAQLRACIGADGLVLRCVRLGGFINATASFEAHAGVMNGASDLMVAALGDAGRHARSTVGVASLPLGAAVEVEGLFEVS